MGFKIKQAHESFVVLKPSCSSTNPYYLKDRKKLDPAKNEKESQELLLSVDNEQRDREPFQTVDISRIRSPNIPYVGSKKGRKTPLLLINKV